MADDSSDGSEKDRDAATVRELRPAGAPGDTMPDITGQYVPPRPLPEASQHRTLDLKSVRISDQADPRRWLTERRLVSPAREPGGSSSKWWLVGGLVALLGAGAWLLFRASPEKTRVPSNAPPVTTAAPPVPLAPARAKASVELAQAAPAPIASSAADRAPPQPTANRAEASGAASVAPKAPAPREPQKKRRDPWVE